MLQTLDKAVSGIAERVRERGARHALRWVRHHIHERWQERRLGIDTAAFDDWKGSAPRDDCHDYEPLAYACIERAVDLLDIRPGAETFLDYGCGKGRAVVVAATRPFRRVIGVDLVEPLCEVARGNVRRAARHFRCRDVEVVAADATQYRLPDDVSVVYLYNPFWDDTLRAVQQRILDSLQASPRRLRILYLLNEGQYDAFVECDWLRRTHDDPDFWERVRCRIYESSGVCERDAACNARPGNTNQCNVPSSE